MKDKLEEIMVDKELGVFGTEYEFVIFAKGNIIGPFKNSQAKDVLDLLLKKADKEKNEEVKYSSSFHSSCIP